LSFTFKPVHIPVLQKEVIEYLDPQPGKKIIDATFDGGGHGIALAQAVGERGRIIGIEIDGVLLLQIKDQISKIKNIKIVQDSYVNIASIVEQEGLTAVDGVLFDLGVSSWHLERSGRGFTFQETELLDMRFDVRQPLNAAQIVNSAPLGELVKLLKQYGEERFARSIAAHIVEARKRKRIISTRDLVDVIGESVPGWYKRRRIHFATKTFQALRIAVNNELDNLETALREAFNLLRRRGRIAVISFHGLEDRIVKNVFREKAKAGSILLTKKPILPTEAEVMENPRSRSAKLRAIEKNWDSS
jgi:16S rRNA (cytosine1402-N4)-methyltransferase